MLETSKNNNDEMSLGKLETVAEKVKPRSDD
jgi:hypothetical protein